MSGERRGYLAYLLRMWQVEEDGGVRWRALLERPGDGERFAFANLEAAFDFLVERTKEAREELPPLTKENYSSLIAKLVKEEIDQRK
jgi:hypothetical protein